MMKCHLLYICVIHLTIPYHDDHSVYTGYITITCEHKNHSESTNDRNHQMMR